MSVIGLGNVEGFVHTREDRMRYPFPGSPQADPDYHGYLEYYNSSKDPDGFIGPSLKFVIPEFHEGSRQPVPRYECDIDALFDAIDEIADSVTGHNLYTTKFEKYVRNSKCELTVVDRYSLNEVEIALLNSINDGQVENASEGTLYRMLDSNVDLGLVLSEKKSHNAHLERVLKAVPDIRVEDRDEMKDGYLGVGFKNFRKSKRSRKCVIDLNLDLLVARGEPFYGATYDDNLMIWKFIVVYKGRPKKCEFPVDFSGYKYYAGRGGTRGRYIVYSSYQLDSVTATKLIPECNRLGGVGSYSFDMESLLAGEKYFFPARIYKGVKNFLVNFVVNHLCGKDPSEEIRSVLQDCPSSFARRKIVNKLKCGCLFPNWSDSPPLEGDFTVYYEYMSHPVVVDVGGGSLFYFRKGVPLDEECYISVVNSYIVGSYKYMGTYYTGDLNKGVSVRGFAYMRDSRTYYSPDRVRVFDEWYFPCSRVDSDCSFVLGSKYVTDKGFGVSDYGEPSVVYSAFVRSIISGNCSLSDRINSHLDRTGVGGFFPNCRKDVSVWEDYVISPYDVGGL